MSKRDLDRYVVEVEKNYFEMLQTAREFDEEVKANRCDPALLERAQREIAPLQANYQRLMYIELLLNKPNRSNTRASRIYKERYGKMQAYLKSNNADDVAVVKENVDALKNLKALVDSIKEKEKENQ